MSQTLLLIVSLENINNLYHYLLLYFGVVVISTLSSDIVAFVFVIHQSAS